MSPTLTVRRLLPTALLAAAFTLVVQPAAVTAEQPETETVALPAGSELYLLANSVSPVLAVTEGDTAATVLDRHDGWLRVTTGPVVGWWNGDRPRAGEGAAAENGTASGGPSSASIWAGDHQATAALADARAQLGTDGRWHPLGPFRLVTDVTDETLLASLQTVATEITALYGARYGLPTPAMTAPPPTGGDSSAVAFADVGAGTVILFTDPRTYRAFAGNHRLAGHSAGRLAALPLHSDERRLRRLLAHEVAHLLNLRAFPGQLPAWLDEGLAGDLELVPSVTDGTLHPGRLGRFALRVAGGDRRYGPLIALDRLLVDARHGRLEDLSDLAALDPGALMTSPRRADLYALTALWVRFLLDDQAPRGQARTEIFHEHLARVASSAAPVPLAPALTDRVMATDFRLWLVDLARRVPREGPREHRLHAPAPSCPFC